MILDKECNVGLVGSSILGHPVWHMRVYRRDLGRMHDWCVIQAIKNEIVGAEYEAFELYPAQSRLMDEGNIYHLWILAPNVGETHPPRIPLGYSGRKRVLMHKKTFERMSPRARREFRAGDQVRLITDEVIARAKIEYPDISAMEAVERFLELHEDILLGLESWTPSELAA